MSLRDYELQKELGKGAQGVVYRAKCRKDTSLVAIKQVHLRNMSAKDQASALHEVRMLAKLDHPFVIRYITSFQEGTNLNIVTDLAESGSLYDLVKRMTRNRSAISERLVWKYFIQTALGLNHIHSRKILHRDVKTMNIFLTKNDDVKVGDLGVARVLENSMDMAKTMVGTPYYLSPELCEGKPYNEKTDMWSLGCVLYELCTLRHPFDASNQGALILKIITGKYPPVPRTYSSELIKVLDSCLQRDTRKRPDTRDLFKFPSVCAFASQLGLSMPGTAPTAHRKQDFDADQKASVEQNASDGKREYVARVTETKRAPIAYSKAEDLAPRTEYKPAERSPFKVKQAAAAKGDSKAVQNPVQNVRPAGIPSNWDDSPQFDMYRAPIPRRPASANQGKTPNAAAANRPARPSSALASRGPAYKEVVGRRRPGAPQLPERVHKPVPPVVKNPEVAIKEIKMKPTTPHAPYTAKAPFPHFFPGTANPTPTRRSDSRKAARPTIDDLARMEVRNLPEDPLPGQRLDSHDSDWNLPREGKEDLTKKEIAQLFDRPKSGKSKAGESGSKLNTSQASLGRVKSAQEGHDDLLDWFKNEHLVAVEGDEDDEVEEEVANRPESSENDMQEKDERLSPMVHSEDGLDSLASQSDQDKQSCPIPIYTVNSKNMTTGTSPAQYSDTESEDHNLNSEPEQEDHPPSGADLLLDAMLGPSRRGEVAQVEWRIVSPVNSNPEESQDERTSSEPGEVSHDDSLTDIAESEDENQCQSARNSLSEDSADLVDQTYIVAQDDGDQDEDPDFPVVFVQSTSRSNDSPTVEVEGDDHNVVGYQPQEAETHIAVGVETHKEEAMELRKRGELLGGAIREARSILIQSLGDSRFQHLYRSVLDAMTKETEVGMDGWGENPDTWQMYQYIYLQQEMACAEARLRALRGSKG